MLEITGQNSSLGSFLLKSLNHSDLIEFIKKNEFVNSKNKNMYFYILMCIIVNCLFFLLELKNVAVPADDSVGQHRLLTAVGQVWRLRGKPEPQTWLNEDDHNI